MLRSFIRIEIHILLDKSRAYDIKKQETNMTQFEFIPLFSTRNFSSLLALLYLCVIILV